MDPIIARRLLRYMLQEQVPVPEATPPAVALGPLPAPVAPTAAPAALPPPAAPAAPISAGDCQHVAGVAVGGWIIVSLLCGAALGVLSTLLFQCFRRRRNARYALQPAPVAMDPAAAGNSKQPPLPGSPQLPPLMPAREPMPRPARSAPVGYGPLTASVQLPAKGSAMAGARGARVSAAAAIGRHQDAPAAGDSRLVDQQAGKQGPALPIGGQGPVPPHADTIRQFVSTEYVDQGGSALSSPGVEMPLPVIAGSPEAADVAALAAAQRASQQHAAQAQPPQQQPAAQAAAAQQRPQLLPQTSTLSVAGAGGGAAAAPHHEVDDSYELDELDADWKALLSDVDARLAAAGAAPMDARERAVAIKKLLVATATRGVDFAMGATIEEVLRFRNFHAGKRD